MHDADPLPPGHPLYTPAGAGWLTRLRVAARALHALSRDPTDSVAAMALNLSLDAEVYARLADEYAGSPEGRALLRERPDLQADAIDFAALKQLPEGTLGRSLADYYAAQGIRPFATPYPARTTVEFLIQRYREIHDAVHIVTGYATDHRSELELQAFAFGNLGLHHCALAVALGALFQPFDLPPVWKYADKLLAAYQRGRRSPDVCLRPRYEHYWALSIEEVRKAVGLQHA